MFTNIEFMPVAAVVLATPFESQDTPSAGSAVLSKSVVYRGGIVTFLIPQDWIEEYEPEGGGIFYEDLPDSGTLRLSVLSFESETRAAEEMAHSAFPADSFEVLPSGFPIRRSLIEASEDGEDLHIHKWEVAVPVPAHAMRLVLFSYSVLAAQEADPAIKEELGFLERNIRQAEYSQVREASGSYQHD